MTTEWEDIQIKLGNMAPREIERPPTDYEYDEMALQNKERLDEERQEKVANASLEELNELEDFEDEDILETYRRRRLQELKEKAAKAKYGEIIEINEPEYKKEVTDAPEDIYVVVFLYKPSIPQCQLLEKHLRILASKFKATKFVKIFSEHAIRNYPDRNLPTLLIYNKSDIVKQIVGLSIFGGEALTTAEVEWELKKCGAVDSPMEEAPPKRRTNFTLAGKGNVFNTRDQLDDDEEDDDE